MMTEHAGIIDSWDDEKGFGFIAVAQGKKFFFHISALRGSHRPVQGDSVFFQAGTDKQGRPIAIHVRSAALTIDNPAIRIKPRLNKKETYRPLKKSQPVNKHRLIEHEIPWLKLLLLLIFPLAGAFNLLMDYGVLWVLPAYLIASVVSYYFYWDDKRRAKNNEWRIPEANLQFWALLGGWPGAFIAQQQFRHKTKKLSFRMVFWIIVITHQLLWFDWVVMDGKWLVALLFFG